MEPGVVYGNDTSQYSGIMKMPEHLLGRLFPLQTLKNDTNNNEKNAVVDDDAMLWHRGSGRRCPVGEFRNGSALVLLFV